MAAILVSAVLDSVAALVNDPNKVTYTYAKMLPYIKIVYIRLQNRLILLGHPFLAEISANTTVTAGSAEITTLAGPLTVKEVVGEPFTLFERAVGANDDSWTPMEFNKWEENRLAGATLDGWVWREGVIKVNPATVNREVKLRFIKNFALITDQTSNLEHDSFADYLAHATAAYIAMFVMKDMSRAEALAELTKESENVMVGIAVKNMQFHGVTRQRRFFRR